MSRHEQPKTPGCEPIGERLPVVSWWLACCYVHDTEQLPLRSTASFEGSARGSCTARRSPGQHRGGLGGPSCDCCLMPQNETTPSESGLWTTMVCVNGAAATQRKGSRFDHSKPFIELAAMGPGRSPEARARIEPIRLGCPPSTKNQPTSISRNQTAGCPIGRA